MSTCTDVLRFQPRDHPDEGLLRIRTDQEERWHSCQCGAELDCDHHSARDILRLSLAGHTIQNKAPRRTSTSSRPKRS